MDHFSKVLQLLIMHTVPQKAMDCIPGLDGLNQVYGPKRPTNVFLSVEYTTSYTVERNV